VGSEDADSCYNGELCHLTLEKAQLSQELRDNHHGQHLGLEQERTAYHWVVEAIRRA
jgi:hypothetical protein